MAPFLVPFSYSHWRGGGMGKHQRVSRRTRTLFPHRARVEQGQLVWCVCRASFLPSLPPCLLPCRWEAVYYERHSSGGVSARALSLLLFYCVVLPRPDIVSVSKQAQCSVCV